MHRRKMFVLAVAGLLVLNGCNGDETDGTGSNRGDPASAGDTATGGDNAGGDSATGDAMGGDPAAGDASAGDSSGGDSAAGDAAAGDPSSGDAAGDSGPNTAPIADAGPDQRLIAGSLVTLDGSGSSDADSDPLTFAWAFSSQPFGSTATLSDPTAVDPTFTADLPGAYVVDLVVNDGAADSAPDSVTIASATVIPDTGQTASHTDTLGEDSDYSINSRSFTDNGDGTITDNVTGLMWQQSDDDASYNWFEAIGMPHSTANPAAAVDVCGNSTLGGHDNWRLPSRKELARLADYGSANPAIDSLFTGTETSPYWSSTRLAANNLYAWYVRGNNGAVDNTTKAVGQGFVRCVRGVEVPSAFADNGDGTITDVATGLMWEQDPGYTVRTWEQALTHCEGLDFAGADDWRLPNITELESINHDGAYNPSVDPLFVATFAAYWSSTTSTATPTDAWYILFARGHVIPQAKTDNGYARCVRGGQ